jgi:two-component system chemotaxis response regulator CheB
MTKETPALEAIVIGASAGAIDALSILLPSLPANYALPLIIVVHLPPDRKSAIAELFQAKCKIRVREVEDKETIENGTAYVAPPGYHVLVEPDSRLSLSVEEEVLFSRPSIDVLFESAAATYGDRLLGVVLTGANSDGAHGLRAVIDAGGAGIVQRPNTAYASAMPEAAIKACPEAAVLDLKEISDYLIRIGGRIRR